jgi:outer membrane protein OmpA-like peptidoglycan-associated protein
VDANGCPILFKGAEKTVILRGVTFATGKSELTSNAETILKDVAASLASNPDVHVEVAGYTDNTGSARTNRRLSQARAEAVAEFLKANGVAASQITAVKGYGPANPIASNSNAAGRERNRRVQLNRTK